MSNIKKATISILLIIICLFSIFITPFTAYASTVQGYTSALDDLKKDLNFDVNNYPSNPESNEIQIIHIGEGVEGELYIYTYQPGNETKHYKAKFINMSLQNPTDQRLLYSRYSLTWLNSEGVFDKYIVNNFTVSNATERYYNISGIYRPYDPDVDTSSSLESIDTVQCKSFPVGQYWRVYYYNNVLMYESNRIDVVEYKVYATGTVRYDDGIKIDHPFASSKTDSHYAAFNIGNYTVDQIIDADITYDIETYSWSEVYAPYFYQEELVSTETIQKQTITSMETGSNDGSGWFGKQYTWNRIMSVDDFKIMVQENTNSENPFDDSELEGLDKSQFVFAFTETEWTNTSLETGAFGHYSTTSNFGILRLHFVSENKTYNLGAVGDLVGTDSDPDAEVDVMDNIINTIEEQSWWQKLIALLLLVLLVTLISPILTIVTPIFKIIFKAIGVCLGVAFDIITFPLRLIFKSKRK